MYERHECITNHEGGAPVSTMCRKLVYSALKRQFVADEVNDGNASVYLFLE